MFVFEMFKPFLDCDYMAAECAGERVCACVCLCLSVRAYAGEYFRGKLFFLL